MKASRLGLIAGIGLLAGCGSMSELKPAPGEPLPVKPLMARTTPTPEQLLTVPTYARPDRVDELVKRSQPRARRSVRPAAADRQRGSRRARRNRSRARLQRNRTSHTPMTNRVRKAVFPVAGLGTRLLPATKSIPKEMITIVDRPLIQYAVDEAREAGIEQMIFVTGRGKSSLEDYFDVGFELETTHAGTRQEPRCARAFAQPLRRDRLGPPAGAARPRPCRVVRPPHCRRRAVRGAAARRSDGPRSAEADGRGVG